MPTVKQSKSLVNILKPQQRSYFKQRRSFSWCTSLDFTSSINYTPHVAAVWSSTPGQDWDFTQICLTLSSLLRSVWTQCGFTLGLGGPGKDTFPHAHSKRYHRQSSVGLQCGGGGEWKNCPQSVCVYVCWGETASQRMWKGNKTIKPLFGEGRSGMELASGATGIEQWSTLHWRTDQCHRYRLSRTGLSVSLDRHSGHIRHS